MSKEELIDKTDKAITELVYPKYDLQKAYNYYNGIRDKDLFKYLEETYGTNTPTALHFTPLIKKHIDALVGEYIGMPIIPKVFCKDKETINSIDRERLLRITAELQSFFKEHLKSSILNMISGKEINDPLVELQMKSIIDNINNSFVSEYEIAALNVIDYIMLSRDTDMTTKLRDLILDLLITGYAFYKVEPTVENNNINIRVLSPLNTFIDRNLESPYVKNSYRVVVRSWLTKTLILNKYGKELSREDIKNIDDNWSSIHDNSMYYVRATNRGTLTSGILAGVEVTPGYPYETEQSLNLELIPVYEVEWLETDKDFVMQRYETVRIGEEVYILRGKNDKVMRTVSNPSYCSLSVNGIYFLNRGSKPWSMVLACSHLLD